jgi:hypothetical protein
LKVVAAAMVLTVPLHPEIADRLALGGEEDQRGDKVGNEQADNSITGVCESRRNFLRKDAEIQ